MVLEITESLPVNDAESVISRMHELKNLREGRGRRFWNGALVAQLAREVPIDILKVDKSFVDDVGE